MVYVFFFGFGTIPWSQNYVEIENKNEIEQNKKEIKQIHENKIEEEDSEYQYKWWRRKIKNKKKIKSKKSESVFVLVCSTNTIIMQFTNTRMQRRHMC